MDLGERDVVLLETNGTTDPLPLVEALLVRSEFVRWLPPPGAQDFALPEWPGQAPRPERSKHDYGLPPLPRPDGCASGAACDLHALAHRFTALQFELPRLLPRDRSQHWLDALPSAILRAKGVVEFPGDPDRFHFLNRIEETVSFGELPVRPPGGRRLALVVGVGLDVHRVACGRYRYAGPTVLAGCGRRTHG